MKKKIMPLLAKTNLSHLLSQTRAFGVHHTTLKLTIAYYEYIVTKTNVYSV